MAAINPVSENVSTKPVLLIVDDEAPNRLLLQRLFARQFQILMAENGAETLDILDQTPVDIVLLDIMMPQMNGLEVLEHVRNHASLADLPIILVTALADYKDVARGLQLGANDYVSKPFDLDVLGARVQTQLTLKRLQDERKQNILELQEAHIFKDRCFQMASHDLKGPLGNIGMAQTLLRRHVEDRPQAHGLLKIIEETVGTMQTVLEEFLDVAALQSGKITLKSSQVHISDVIDELVTQYELTAHNKEIRIEVSIKNPIVYADSARLAQALSNLLSNAIKYSPLGATIRIWTEQRENQVRVLIADQGMGIPADERERLFTPFGKLSPRPTNGENSTGLGLWIVKYMTELQHGSVGVECPEEGGSIFWVELPTMAEAVFQST